MGFGFSGSKTSVEISGGVDVGLPEPTTAQTLINGTGNSVNGTATVFTVPADTIYYVTAFLLAVTTGGINWSLKNSGTAVTPVWLTSRNSQESNHELIFPSPLKFTAGETLDLSADNNTGRYGYVGYSVAV